MANIPTGKNIVAARIDADGNVIVGDGNNITVINLKEAAQYKSIEADIQKLDEQFLRAKSKAEKYPDDHDFRLEMLRLEEERCKKQEDLETLKQAVLKLADDFQRIPINTERLQIAKDHFEKGEFEAARAILHAEEMVNELDVLISESERLHQKTEENQQHRRDKANEFLILARLTAIDFSFSDYYEKTLEYFEQSLRAERRVNTLSEYAIFLHEHNEFAAAQLYYDEVLQIYRELSELQPRLYLPFVALTLNNLAGLYEDKSDDDSALEKYEEALHLYRELSDEIIKILQMDSMSNNWAKIFGSNDEYGAGSKMNERVLLIFGDFLKESLKIHQSHMHTILIKSAVIYTDRNESNAALEKYEEASQIYRILCEDKSDRYHSDMILELQNFALFQADKKGDDTALKKYEEVLHIYREKSVDNPMSYCPDMALTLFNLATLYAIRNEDDIAQKMYEEALQIYREFSQLNPRKFQPYVAMTLLNLGNFYYNNRPDREKCIACTIEVIKITKEYPDLNPQLKKCAFNASQLLQAHGVDSSTLFDS